MCMLGKLGGKSEQFWASLQKGSGVDKYEGAEK